MSSADDSVGANADDESATKALAALSATAAPSPALGLQNDTKPPSQQGPVGHDTSHLVHQPHSSAADPTLAAQNLADNREPSYTRQEPTTAQIRQAPGNSAITSLKHHHNSRTQSPLRESSVPVPSTETSTMNSALASKVPSKPKPTKKGTATVSKVSKSKPAPKSKKPAPKRITSTSATPATSPGPRSGRTGSSPRSSPEAEDGEQAFSDDEQEEEGDAVSDSELYCLCRRPDTGTFMIGCDGGCDDWFHGKCVGIAERDKGLIDRYICPNCQENGLGITTWKRMCRREGCRMPAKVQNGSKYCSEQCGELFFKELLATKTRQIADSTATGKNAKKANQTPTEDLGPRGGMLSKAELKALLDAAPTMHEFKRLGDGTLSPPTASPNTKSPATATQDDTSISLESALNDIERERIEQISQQKETTRARHSLLKDRAKFITMLKASATRLAEERNLKAKELCGFDDRITWTEDQFQSWRISSSGQESLINETLPSSTDVDGDVSMTAETSDSTICTKRRCARHFDWAKLSLEDTRHEITGNAETMRNLDKEEKEIKERARLRAREIRAGGVGGSVEFHGDEEKKRFENVVGDVGAAVAADKAAISVDVVEDENEREMEKQQENPDGDKDMIDVAAS